ncbi:hypothetical protein L2X67_01850 [Enterobacter ludwigii]|nr:hypothetical protein [Enterobacter ludwigii]
MSTICLAAQRSYTTGEAVWFSYRFPSLRKVITNTVVWMVSLCAMLMAGLYTHTYWNLRHPSPEPIQKVSVVKPETQISDMHYVYVSKPFPHPEPKPAPAHHDIPAMQDLPINSDDADWQQAPEGTEPHDTSRDTLTELFKQALKEQEQDYSQGKIPAPPVDETQDNSPADVLHKADNRSPLSQKGDRLE